MRVSIFKVFLSSNKEKEKKKKESRQMHTLTPMKTAAEIARR